MRRRKLKRGIIYGLYAFAFLTVLSTIYLVEMATNPTKLKDDTSYVNDTIIDDYTPVVNIDDTIIRPYTASSITIGRAFYDYQDTAENQINSLVHFDNMYLPNSGVDYKSDEVFDVTSILDGTVTKVTEKDLLGKIVEITHKNNLVSVYESLSEVNVSLNDQVTQGQVIGKSGNSNISTDLGNHLHFELIYNGSNVNPENYYDKKISDL